MDKVKILSADIALNGTGLCMELESGKIIYERFAPDKEMELHFRIHAILKKILDYDPEIVILENLNAFHPKQIAMYNYLLMSLRLRFITVYGFTPTKWQVVHKFYNAHGDTTKARSLYVSNKLGAPANSHDEADALCMLVFYKLVKSGHIKSVLEDEEPFVMRSDQSQVWKQRQREEQMYCIFDKINQAYFSNNKSYTLERKEMLRINFQEIDGYIEKLKANGYQVKKVKIGKIAAHVKEIKEKM